MRRVVRAPPVASVMEWPGKECPASMGVCLVRYIDGLNRGSVERRLYQSILKLLELFIILGIFNGLEIFPALPISPSSPGPASSARPATILNLEARLLLAGARMYDILPVYTRITHCKSICSPRHHPASLLNHLFGSWRSRYVAPW